MSHGAVDTLMTTIVRGIAIEHDLIVALSWNGNRIVREGLLGVEIEDENQRASLDRDDFVIVVHPELLCVT